MTMNNERNKVSLRKAVVLVLCLVLVLLSLPSNMLEVARYQTIDASVQATTDTGGRNTMMNRNESTSISSVLLRENDTEKKEIISAPSSATTSPSTFSPVQSSATTLEPSTFPPIDTGGRNVMNRNESTSSISSVLLSENETEKKEMVLMLPSENETEKKEVMLAPSSATASLMTFSPVQSSATTLTSTTPPPPSSIPAVDVAKKWPLINRWHHKLSNGGFVFFKHLRKSAGTSMHRYLTTAVDYHLDSTRAVSRGQTNSSINNENVTVDQQHPWISLYHQEFCSMAYTCATIDPRWSLTLSFIVLRDPIDRQLSEFFYSGPGGNKTGRALVNNIRKDPAKFEDELVAFMRKTVPDWIQLGISLKVCARNFCSEYQAKMLSGATGKKPLPWEGAPYSCLDEVRRKQEYGTLKKICAGQTPCAYGNCYGGGVPPKHVVVTSSHLKHAKRVLDEFDLVLLSETVSTPEQASMVADIVNMPESVLSLVHQKANVNSRGVFGGYQDLLERKAPDILEIFQNHSIYERDLYQYALQVNQRLVTQWTMEKALLNNNSHVLESL